MRTLRNKNKVSTITFVVILTIGLLMAGIPVVTAHDPPWSIPTFAYISLAPTTVGVGQQVMIYMWISISPVPTAAGAYGDRWHNYTVEVTDPDGSKETLGPFDSDPIGFAWEIYTPDQAGTYDFQFSFPGQTLAGENLHPYDPTGWEFIGDYFEPSTSEVVSLTVQEEPVEPYPATPAPEDYWTRPIDAQHRDWWPISGNWLAKPANMFARYTEGPETAHILWTKPITFGGLVGGEFGATSYHCGNAYEGKWWPPVIINGRLYYNLHPDNFFLQFPGLYPESPLPKPGFVSVDLRTGEELWRNNDTRIEFGQIYDYDSPNQHGAFAYLWTHPFGSSAFRLSGALSGTYEVYDAFSGEWVYTVENVPTGVQVYGPDGNVLRYVLGPVAPPFAPPVPPSWLALWDSSAIPELLGGPEGTQNWMWRPYGKTVDGRNGYLWNVTIPAGITGTINHVLEDRIIGSTGLGATGWLTLETKNFSIWALSLKPGEEGKRMWKEDYVGPGGITLEMGTASLEDGVFILRSAQTRQWWGYSLDNGKPLWGPTEPQAAWDMTWGTMGYIAYGKLFSAGYAGILYCYNVTTGDLEWTYKLKCPYYLESKWGSNYIIDEMFIADGKIYLTSGEHSPDDPKERGSPLACVDIETGDELWTIPFYSSEWSPNPAIADGIIVYLNTYDNRIYAFGKGQTATTVSAPQTTVATGATVLIQGTVTDQSPGAKGTPCVSKDSMSAWMEYLYMQFPCPMDTTGVPVKLEAFGADGSYIDIGTVTSDVNGFRYEWIPPDEGLYTILATFNGDESYWMSWGATGLSVGPAPEEPVTPAVQEDINQAVDSLTPILYGTIAAVAVAIVIGIVNLWALRKRT